MFPLLRATWGVGLAILTADAALVEHHPARERIVYIETHSTGAGTLTNVLHRYCDNYDKECYVPSHAGKMCTQGCLEKIAAQAKEANRTIDVWPNYAVYVPALLDDIVPGSFTISVFRDPLDRTMSAYAHGPAASVLDALATVQRNEPALSVGKAGTRMSVQVPLEHFDKLDFVILMEKYNLGLVLLKRRLHWRMEDIVYVRFPDHPTVEAETMSPLKEYLSLEDENLTEAAKAFKESCCGGDEAELYKRAQAKFWQQYSSLSIMEQIEVDAEVKVFEEVLPKVQLCCSTAKRTDKFCNAMATDNGKWVKHHDSSFGSFMQKRQKTGCLTLVPEM